MTKIKNIYKIFFTKNFENNSNSVQKVRDLISKINDEISRLKIAYVIITIISSLAFLSPGFINSSGLSRITVGITIMIVIMLFVSHILFLYFKNRHLKEFLWELIEKHGDTYSESVGGILYIM